MQRLLATAVAIVLLAAPAAAQLIQVPPNSVVYVEDSEFGQALMAALHKKKTPVRVTTNREQAEFFLAESSEASKEGTAERVTKILAFGAFAGNGRRFEATTTLTDKDGIVVFAYNVKKNNFQSAAEAVAKHLGDHIKKSNKK